jgi:amino acid transporter
VAAAAGIFSPISLTIACLILFLYRPILLELGSAIPVNGANYTYLLQFSGKTLAIISAAATLLDAASTSTVSAATAGAYLKGEFPNFRLPTAAFAVILLVLFVIVALFSVRESTAVTLSFTLIHVSHTMLCSRLLQLNDP